MYFICFGIILFLNKEKIKFYNLFQGIIIYLVIFTKQNIGAFYLIGLIIAEIYFYRKKGIINILKSIVSTLILSVLTIIIMIYQGNFQGFLNYTVLGMGEFTGGNVSIQETVEIIIVAYGIIAILSYILTYFLVKTKEIKDKSTAVLLIFAVFLNFSAYPIFNLYHTSFAILLNVIVLIYILDTLLLKRMQSDKVKIILLISIYIVINIFSISCGLKASKNTKITDKNHVYYSVNLSEELNTNLDKVTQYILKKEKEGIDVICISSDAALYMTALNKNHQELDLIFEGNLGYNGKENTIEKIKKLDNIEILMNADIYWQELSELREYIIFNYKKIDMIGNCFVFAKDN